jgi:outer membrane protein assembly factor BamB
VTSGPLCGNGACNLGESCSTCTADCQACTIAGCDTSGAQPGAAVSMQGYCSSNNHRSPYAAPTATDKLWTTAAKKPFYGPVIGRDGTIYAGSDDGALHAINPDGTQKWAFMAGNSVRTTPAIGADGTIYAGSEDTSVYAVNPDGTQKWVFKTGSYVNASPVLGADGTIYIGSWDKSLYALHPDGTQKWAYPTDEPVTQAVALGKDSVHLVAQHGNLTALGLDGKKLWDFNNSNTAVSVTSPPVIGPDGSLYSATFNEGIQALDASGKALWFFAGSGQITSPTVAADGTVYAASSSAQVYVIGSDGKSKATFDAKDTIRLAPVLTADGQLVVGSKDGNVYVLDKDGKQKAAIKTGPVIGLALGDNRLVVVTDDGQISAYGK